MKNPFDLSSDFSDFFIVPTTPESSGSIGGGSPPSLLGAPIEVGEEELEAEAAVAASGDGGPGSVVSVGGPTSAGLTINLVFDQAAMNAPQSFRDGITAAMQMICAVVTDKVTINLSIDYSGTGGGAAGGASGGYYEPYTLVRTNLINHASPGDTTFNSLPTGSTIAGQTDVAVWYSQLKVWGLMDPNGTEIDGSTTFATDINPNLLVGVALHELTHAMGRVPYGPPYGQGQPDIFDLFRFTSAGHYLIDGDSTAVPGYFSTNGGVSKIADYGQNSDPSDFLNSGVQGSSDPFNEFYSGNTQQKLTAIDLMQLDALGFHLTTGNHAPVVSVPQTVISATPGQQFAASSLFSASDADGDTLSYFLWDDNASANSGHFVVNGTVVPAQTAYAVTAAQLAQLSYVAGSAGTSDDLYVKAYDGQLYSNNGIYNYFHVNTAAPAGADHAPVVSVPHTVISATPGQSFAASSLFSASDADGNTLSYFLWDDNASANSGHFVVNGTVVPAQTAYAVTAAQLAQLSYVAGSAGTSDDLYVKAYDGQLYSNNGIYNYFHVNTAAPAGSDHAPVVSVPQTVISATPGQQFAASSLFSASDADGDTLSYFLWDDNASANSGHFVVNGTVVPAQTAYAVTAAQLAQLSYVAGSAGTSDDLYVKAYDGQLYSNNGFYNYFHVNTGAGSGVAPSHDAVVSADHGGLGGVASGDVNAGSTPLDHLIAHAFALLA